MAYPFDSPVVQFASLVKPLDELADTETPFDENFPDNLPTGKAYAFDTIKNQVCAYRSSHASQKLRSADAFLPGTGDQAEWYFIEFKNSKLSSIQSVKDPDRNELMQKAFDSLTIAAMTFGRRLAMQQIQERSVFIVVFPSKNYSEMLLANLSELAGRGDKPLWNLDKLASGGLYKRILTIDETRLSDMWLPYMN